MRDREHITPNFKEEDIPFGHASVLTIIDDLDIDCDKVIRQ